MSGDVFTFFKDQFGLTGVLMVVFGAGLFLLAKDLANLRTTLKQQMASSLLDQRFKAYGQLWTNLEPLALYSRQPLSAAAVGQLETDLSKWYFSAQGGMFLSTRARDFYFALQEALRAAANLEAWECSQRPAEPRRLMESFLWASLADSEYSDFDPAALETPQHINHGVWLEVCKSAAKRLERLKRVQEPPDNQVVFAFLQQVSSALRTILAADLQSRLDPNVPRIAPMWSR
jgi:hypothetical protein